MERATVSATTPVTPGFRDGLGERRDITDPSGKETLELLCLRSELSTVPSFEFALRERVSRLASFRHAQFGRARGVERLTDVESTLAVVSERPIGVRLSDLLVATEQRRLGLDITAALCLIRQLVPAVAAFHESARDVAHGAIGPERLVVTPDGQLVIVEYVLGAALEQLRYPRERYWSDLRVALPSSAGFPRFDQRGDVTQMGVVALSLILGRPMRVDEFPARIADVVASTWAVSPGGGLEPLPQGLRGWLGRALQLDIRTAFTSAAEARAELDKVIGEGDYIASPTNLAAFLARYNGNESGATPYPPPARPTSAKVAAEPTPAAPAAIADTLGASVSMSQPATTTPPRGTATPVAPLPKAVDPMAMTPPLGTPAYAKATAGEPVFAKASAEQAPVVSPPAPPTATASARPAPAVPATPPRGTPPLASAPTPTPAPALQIQSLADSMTVRTPPRGTPRGSIPAPAPRPAPIASAPKPQFDTFDDDDDEQPPREWRKLAALAAVLLTFVTLGALAGRWYLTPAPATLTTGTLVITTNPSGAQAIVDGRPRGVTPLTLDLAVGPHKMELKGPAGGRSVTVTIGPGAQLSQYIELPQPVAGVGQLMIRTEPGGARVTVDGVARGMSPMTVAALSPGDHVVVLESPMGSVKQSVTIEPGATAQLVVPLSAPEGAHVSGWVAVTSAIELQLFENDRLLGSSRSDRIMVSAGRHEVDLVNEELGYRATRTVDVAAGKVAPIAVDLPKGTIALNAAPWAEVWIDGTKVGETPIGNLSLAIGRHDVVFRHPELGEQRHSATVTLKDVARLSVDFKKP